MLGKKLATFSLPSTGGADFDLAAAKGKKLVIYFYPKDNTPGCTTESEQFRDLHDRFQAANVIILGVSRDSLKSHEGFKTKLGLPFDLLSDSDEALCLQFAVMKMKSMYGKQVRGIERSTFVIDEGGKLIREWRGVKVPGHAQEVLEFIESR